MMHERAEESLQKAVSEFINRESNRRSMITVTGAALDRRGAHANVFISVFPEKDLRGALDFLNRNRDELKRYLKAHMALRAIPRVRFLPDPVLGGSIEPEKEA